MNAPESKVAAPVGGVDVLAVMDDAAHALNHTRTASERIALLEARAAVAELVAALRNANRSARIMHDDRQQEVVCIEPADWHELRAALARMKGGAA